MDELVVLNEMMSVKEVYNEIAGRNDFISIWAEKNKNIFATPEAAEYPIITEIMLKHKELVKYESITSGKAAADPFLIAKAKVTGSILITNETFIPNAHKIPNVCKEYNIKCINLKEFMVEEKWRF